MTAVQLLFAAWIVVSAAYFIELAILIRTIRSPDFTSDPDLHAADPMSPNGQMKILAFIFRALGPEFSQSDSMDARRYRLRAYLVLSTVMFVAINFLVIFGVDKLR